MAREPTVDLWEDVKRNPCLQEDMEAEKYPLFQDAIERILHYGVTIEQESFLNK